MSHCRPQAGVGENELRAQNEVTSAVEHVTATGSVSSMNGSGFFVSFSVFFFSFFFFFLIVCEDLGGGWMNYSPPRFFSVFCFVLF